MSYTKDLVSIIIPVYNGGNFLKQAIDSALNQTYKNIEIIVINDGSNDNGKTEQIALSYKNKIKYFKCENHGCPSAINFGISKSSGEWFSWLSHDDLYDKNKIAIQIEASKKYKDAKLIYINTQNINAKNKKLLIGKSKLYGQYDNFIDQLLFSRSFCGCGFLIHRTLIDKVGPFNQNLTMIPDFEYWLRIGLVNSKFVVPHKKPLVFNRIHHNQVSVIKKDLFEKEFPLVIGNFYQQCLENNDYENALKFLVYIKAHDLPINVSGDIGKKLKINNKEIKKLKRKTKIYKSFKKVYWSITRQLIAK